MKKRIKSLVGTYGEHGVGAGRDVGPLYLHVPVGLQQPETFAVPVAKGKEPHNQS